MDSESELWGQELTGEHEGQRPLPSLIEPPITEALRAEARTNPGAWVYAIDPGFDGQANVPPQGVIGAWRSDEHGEIDGAFVNNPRYSPTPQARGWAEPLTQLERVLQLVLAGYLPDKRLAQEFSQSEVFIFSRREGGLFLAPAQDGGQLVYVYTDAIRAVSAGHEESRATTGARLAASLPPGVRIALNPGSTVSAILQPEDVASA